MWPTQNWCPILLECHAKPNHGICGRLHCSQSIPIPFVPTFSGPFSLPLGAKKFEQMWWESLACWTNIIILAIAPLGIDVEFLSLKDRQIYKRARFELQESYLQLLQWEFDPPIRKIECQYIDMVVVKVGRLTCKNLITCTRNTNVTMLHSLGECSGMNHPTMSYGEENWELSSRRRRTWWCLLFPSSSLL